MVHLPRANLYERDSDSASTNVTKVPPGSGIGRPSGDLPQRQRHSEGRMNFIEATVWFVTTPEP